MSNEAINWAYKTPAKGGAKFVLVTLANYANESFYCYPSQRKLCEMTGMGERTIRRHLAELEESGLISRHSRINEARQYTSDGFYLAVEPAAKMAGASGQNGRSQRPKWPEPAAKMAGNTLEEPSVEPSDIYIDGFKEFYELYPRKKSPLKAKAAYLKARKETDHESIIRGLREYIAHICREGTEDKFIKHPATWLNGGCWADDYTSPTNATGTGSSATGYERGLMAAIARGQRHEGGF